MTVKEISQRILTLEFRQERGDADYGSCLWARFYFNLDRYELMIMSDCGNYGYKWCETPEAESFLQLMARCSAGYIKDKIYGTPKVFDYEATKRSLYEMFRDEEDCIEKLNEIFESIESEYYEPVEGNDFMRMFDEYNDGYFSDTFEFPHYVYPADVEKICNVFEKCIRPKIREILKEDPNA